MGSLEDVVEAVDERGKSASTALIELAEKEGVEFLRSTLKEPFAAVSINGHRELHPVRSGTFKNWLCGTYFFRTKRAISPDAVNAALNVFEARAAFEGEEHELHNKVAYKDGAVIVDLGTPSWEVVRVTKDGWEIVQEPSVLFRRYSHMAPHPIPHRGGNVERVLEFVNIKDEDDRLLIKVFLVTAFLPHIPRAILILHGPQGAAKSFAEKIVKALIDPSHIPLLSLPASVPELVQLLQHTYFAVFDNVTELRDYQSDVLCRAVTGEGFVKRELYSDQEDIIFSFRRLIALNGINVAARKPDLLDRSILLPLDRLTKKARRREEAIWEEFEEARPSILGGIFDTLSKTLAIVDEVRRELDELPRMADWCVWGEAVARAMGCPPGVFHQAYFKNIKRQNREVLEGATIGPALLELVNRHPEGWEGTPTDLYGCMEKIAEELKVNTRAKGWPKRANSLSRKLKLLVVNLREEGIEVDFGREGDTQGTRTLRIKKISSESPDRQSGPGKSSDDISDDIVVTQETVREPSEDSGPGLCQSDGSDGVSQTSRGGAPQAERVRSILEYVAKRKDATRTNVAAGLATVCPPDATFTTIVTLLDDGRLIEDPTTKFLACGRGRPA